MRTVYLNGEYVLEKNAKVSIFDRAFLFSDAVYEVTTVLRGKLVDFSNHMKRLKRSMKELNFDNTINEKVFLKFHRELIIKNNLKEGIIYLQVSRGIAERDFNFPKNLEPTISAFTQKKKLINNSSSKKGISIITIEDFRWKRCDIKTTQLLYPSFAKNEAFKRGADDAWMTKNNYIMEGTSNNAWIIRNKIVYTRQADNLILNGITRKAVLDVAKDIGYKVIFKQFTTQEAELADEAFITSATTFVTGVIKINGKSLKKGKIGIFTKELRKAYINRALKNLK